MSPVSMPKEGLTCCDGFFWMRYIFFKSDWLSLPERLPSLFALLSHFPWWGRTQERRRMNKLKSLKKKVWDTSKRVRLLKRGREKKYISSMSLMLCRPRFRGTGHNTVYSQMQRMLTNLSLLPQSWRWIWRVATAISCRSCAKKCGWPCVDKSL